MRITTWNINSVRLRLPLLKRVVAALKPDIVCLQETKADDTVFPIDGVRALGFEHVLIRGQKSYNGVAILSRAKLAEGPRADWCGRDDCRHIVAHLPGRVELHNFYVPAGGDVPDPKANDKFAHKLDFIAAMTEWSKGLAKGRRILVGDLNIAPLETDVWSHKQLLDVVSHTPVETEGLKAVMAAHGWVDAVRHFVPPEEKLYTWWSYRNRTWPGDDRGRRLDHVWVAPAMRGQLKSARVLREARGWDTPSDHVPVTVDVEL
ncbi:MAG TPA: exodeoxyribonuclease III [Alphaproteobacteria bacterium]